MGERNLTGAKQRKRRKNLCYLGFRLFNFDDCTGGQVQINFNKLTSDGVNIYSKRDGDADFIYLARDTESPYIDTRPLKVPGKPEIREYKAMFVVGDEEIGIFSHELVVNCAP